MKKKLPTIVLCILFLVGLTLLLYPSVSDYWNSMHASKAVADYSAQVYNLNEEEYDEMLADAQSYNKKLAEGNTKYSLSDEEEEEYNSLLNLDGSGIMGYIEIPAIDVTLPIYHGTSDEVLQIAVGHLEWSSLPVGGTGSHCVLSGHRGLPSAKLFTNLDKLVEGDTFILRVLDEVYTYEVDQIRIVEPDEVNELTIEEGKDYCTLVTCTPYGINTHRLLVRGHRIENVESSEEIRVTSDAIKIDPLIVAPILAVPILLLLFILLMLPNPKKSGSKKNRSEK